MLRAAEAEAIARQETMRKQKDPLQELNAGQHGAERNGMRSALSGEGFRETRLCISW